MQAAQQIPPRGRNGKKKARLVPAGNARGANIVNFRVGLVR